jgi:hypothetical protein
VQYGSIKTLALVELGRYDLVEAALGEEVTDDAHPFGQANQAFARAHYLGAIEAWEPAAAAVLAGMQQASALSAVGCSSASRGGHARGRAGEVVRRDAGRSDRRRRRDRPSVVASAEAELRRAAQDATARFQRRAPGPVDGQLSCPP